MSAAIPLPGSDIALDSALLAAAFDACPESLAIVERARIVYANPAFAHLFDYRHASEVQGKMLADFLPEDRRCAQGSWQEQWQQQSACGYPACRFQGKRRDGTQVAMEAACSRFHAAGRTLLMIAAHDVSQPERRRLVRESERRFRTIFEASAIGISHCTLDARIVESNRSLEQILGYGHEELRGMHFRDFLHADDLAIDLECFEEMKAGKRDSYQLETRYIRKDRAHGWARLTVSLVRGPDNSPEFAIAMLEDITERKQAEQQLREAQKMEAIGRLVGGVAHDFNNLLTGIMLYCDLLLGGLEADSRFRHHAEEIRLASEHGAALIQQLLAVARQQVVEPRVLCLNEIICGMTNLLARLIGENIELQVNLAKDLGSLKIDPTQAEQIILNLVLNARDAMPDGGHIILETRNGEGKDGLLFQGQKAFSGPGILFSVTDTGCGMNAETRARLFEPFFTTKRPGKGNGLGLATVHRAVTESGGSIEVQSEPGKGTRVSILWPRVESEVESAAGVPELDSLGGQETVLLVEDDSAVRRSARRLLSERGYKVLEAPNGNEALRICRNHQDEIHLLLADVVMPGMSGPQVAQQARLLRPGLAVLYTSGYHQASAGESLPPGTVVVFRKPFSGSVLLRKVREALSTREAKTSDPEKTR